MSAKLELMGPGSVLAGREAKMFVDVEGARPGSHVTVTVEHRKGASPTAEPQCKVVRVDAAGRGGEAFDFVFEGKGRAILIATAYDAQRTFFEPEGESVEVT